MSSATKARIDTAYQRLREHLAYLGLSTASEELAPALERARTLRLSAVEVLEDLMAKEAEATRARRLAGRLRFAHYPLRKTLADFEFDYQPSIDRKTLGELSALRFVEERRNVLLLGPPGVGKTHCETGLGDPGACRRTIPGRRGLTRSLIGHRTCALAWSCRPMPSRASLVRLAPVTARRSRVDRWQAGVGNQGRPQRVTGRPRACLRVDLSPRLPAPARPTERWPDQKPVRPRA
jgi:hypothetical protein